MKMASGNDLLAKELREVHSAEQLLSRALPKLAKKISADQVREKLEERLEEGTEIIEAVEHGLEELEVGGGRKRNHAVEGLLDDAKELVEQIESEDILDAALIAAIQKVQHYCIAAWGTIGAYARELEAEDLVQAMERAVENGTRFDQELTELAEQEINPRIFEMSEDEEGDEGEDEKEDGEGKGRAEAESAGQRQGGRGRRQDPGREARSQEREGQSQQREGRSQGQSGSGRGRGESSEQRGRSSGREGGRSGGSRTASSGRESGRNGGSNGSSGRNGGGRGSEDLRSREYRDREGNVRHHTRSYMERQRGK